MEAPAGPLGEQELQLCLLARAATLRSYVAAKIPRSLSTLLTVDDVLQETWVAAFRHIRSFVPNGPGSMDRWLTMIANRKLIDGLRRAQTWNRQGTRLPVVRAPEQTASMFSRLALVAAPLRTPSGEVSMREAADAVQIALGGLREDQRSVIRMRYLDGMSLKQIADRLGRSSGAVSALLFRGLRDLRTRLGQASKFFSDVRSTDAPPESSGAPATE